MKTNKILAVIVTLLCLITVCDAKSKKNRNEEPPKYVFLFIGDGMGFSHVATTESYLSYKAGKIGGEQVRFTTFPIYGSAASYSANSRVTDSSAAGTAISTGVKTDNSMLGTDPEGNKLKSMSYDFQEMGYNIGIVSSVPVNHATPAAFYSKNGDRYTYYNISLEIPTSGFQYFAGSGIIEYFGKNNDRENITEVLEKNGMNVCFDKNEIEEALQNKDKMIVCQPYNKDAEPANYEAGGIMPEGHILLSEMLEIGMKRLGSKEPFFIMCEGGEIDWAAHSNKTMPMVNAILEFDKAIELAYQFYLEHADETLIVVTADHATGGVSLNSEPDWKIMEEKWVEANFDLEGAENRETNRKSRIGWTTTGHTGEDVPVYAIGKGAEKFSGHMDNTEFKAKILGK